MEMKGKSKAGPFLVGKAPTKSKASYEIRVGAQPSGKTSCISSARTEELLSGICSLIVVEKFACYFLFILPTKEITDEPETTKTSVL